MFFSILAWCPSLFCHFSSSLPMWQCHSVDQFGDHLLGCEHGPMRIHRHDALCDVIYHALLQDNTGFHKEQRCAGSRLDRPGGVFHPGPDFLHGKPAYFDVTVHCPLQESLLGRSAVSASVAAAKGEEDKDAHHDELVQAAGGVFVPLVVESLGLWSAAIVVLSCRILL